MLSSSRSLSTLPAILSTPATLLRNSFAAANLRIRVLWTNATPLAPPRTSPRAVAGRRSLRRVAQALSSNNNNNSNSNPLLILVRLRSFLLRRRVRGRFLWFQTRCFSVIKFVQLVEDRTAYSCARFGMAHKSWQRQNHIILYTLV